MGFSVDGRSRVPRGTGENGRMQITTEFSIVIFVTDNHFELTMVESQTDVG